VAQGNGIGGEKDFRRMPRNRFQRGSIKTEARNGGSWFVLRYHLWIRQPDGSEKRKEKRVPLGPVARIGTKAAAQHLAQPYIDKANAASFGFLKADILFPDFFDIYFDNQKLTIRHSTVLTNECYRKVFTKFFARHKLSAMGGDDFQAFVHWMVREDYAPTTIHNTLQVLKQSWKWAIAKKYPVDRDAFLELKVPPKTKPEQEFFSTDECFTIIRGDKEPWMTMEWIAFETGVRPSELLALSKRSLRFFSADNEEFLNIRILETVSPRTGEIRPFGKTKNARRDFDVSPELAAHIKRFLETVSGDFLFTNSDGSPISYFQFARHLKARLKEVGLEGSAKAFRHGNASEMSSQNTPKAVIIKRLGHFDIDFTERNYVHVVNSDELKLAKHFGSLARAALQ
jgi:integrase